MNVVYILCSFQYRIDRGMLRHQRNNKIGYDMKANDESEENEANYLFIYFRFLRP